MSHSVGQIVSTSTGRIRGIKDEKKNQYLFLGIPYAEPPVGELRFRPTKPKQAWEGVFEASAFGAAGPQVFDPSEGNYEEFTGSKTPPADQAGWVGAEDNLTLNIWTSGTETKKPVIVWIHGGANWLESSRLDTYNGAKIAERGDVVFVSINYRLGVFGWLDVSVLGGEEYRGSHSHGLYDQVTALKWIKQNIGAFGGDDENITVLGESAGSIDLSWLLTSGHLNGIAKRVVLMSGIAGLVGLSGDLGYGFSEEYARELSKNFLRKLEINSMPELLAISTQELMDRYTKVVKSSDILFEMDSLFWPRVIPDFVPTDPFRAAVKNGSHGIDVMVGYTTYEMGLWLTWDETLDTHPCEWSAEKIQDFDESRQNQAVEIYRKSLPDEPDGRRGMHMIGDSIFVIPSLWFADEISRHTSNIWMYQFDWQTDERRKALHAGDQTFLFGSLDTQAGHHLCGVEKDIEDRAKRDRLTFAMQDAIIAFSRVGDPNAHSNPDLPEWPRYEEKSRLAMSFDLTNKIVQDPRRERRNWWYENVYGPALK